MILKFIVFLYLNAFYTQTMNQDITYQFCMDVKKHDSNKCLKSRRKISSDSTSFSSRTSEKKLLNASKLHIILTKKGLQVYGTWSKAKLLRLLTDKLLRCIHTQSMASRNETFSNSLSEAQVHSITHSGLYNMNVLRELQGKGMSQHDIMKVMKLGLVSLNHCELEYFKDFQIEPYILELEHMWTRKFDEKLITNLRTIGLSEDKCWNIIVFGIMHQSSDILYRLLLSGIDVPGILSWQSPISSASSNILQFLRLIGIEENVVQLVEQYGIDKETLNMLIDLGYNKMEEQHSDLEDIICECSVTLLESHVCSLEKTNSDTTSTSFNTLNYFHPCACKSYPQTEKEMLIELTAQRNDYLRQTVMVPLTWAMARALRYGPSDPKYYIAYQLLRWKHGNVPQTEKENVEELVALATIAMDRQLIEKKVFEEENFIKNINLEATRNNPCNICKEYQQCYRIKERCWKCSRKSTQTYSACDFPLMCSSCKIDTSDKIDDTAHNTNISHK